MEKVWQKKILKCATNRKITKQKLQENHIYLQDLNAATRDTTTDFHGRRRKFLYLTEENNRPKAVTKIDNRDYVRRR